MTTTQPPGQPRLAAIDVGTNTIRLIVAEVETRRHLPHSGRRAGDGAAGRDTSDRTGRLSDEAIERALAAIGKMKAIADGFEVTEIRAIATSAVREAANGRGLLSRGHCGATRSGSMSSRVRKRPSWRSAAPLATSISKGAPPRWWTSAAEVWR